MGSLYRRFRLNEKKADRKALKQPTLKENNESLSLIQNKMMVQPLQTLKVCNRTFSLLRGKAFMGPGNRLRIAVRTIQIAENQHVHICP